jgi:hypothetical protein
MNVGNYQSVHITAGFEDTLRDGESPEEGFRRVEAQVEERIGVQANKIAKRFNGDSE